ncbi:serine hydrolase domain-containing protein [Actinoplanes sp. NPDC004185]
MRLGPFTAMSAVLATGMSLCLPVPAEAGPMPAVTPPLDPTAVRAFIDRTVPAQLAKWHIPGAAVSVVSAGRPLMAAGYGVTDLTSTRPVDPGNTAMELGSVAKVFTAVAVLQQVERGTLDLDTDVNRYLRRFAVADTYPGRPVTLAHLLTHTSGFQTFTVGIAADEPVPAGDLEAWLAAHQPRRVRPPGLLPAYDNYGVALAGHLVELASGEDFAGYVDRHILRPLAMSGTSFAQPLPPRLETGRATGHRYRGGRQVVARARFGPLVPAGSGPVTTAADMARFAAAQFGTATSAPILSRAMLELLQRRRFAVDDRLSGMALIFEEHRHGSDRILLKDGTTTGFHGKLVVVPERGVALYVSYNGLGDAGGAHLAGAQLVSSFLDTFLPSTAAPAVTVTAPADRYAGTYRTTRTPADITRIQALFDNVTVTARPDGTLKVSGVPTPDPAQASRRWRPIGDGLFADMAGADRIAFHRDRAGHLTMVAGQEPSEAYERLGPLDSPERDLGLLLTAWAIAAVTVLAVPGRVGVRRIAGRYRRARLDGRSASLGLIWGSAVGTVATAVVLILLLGDDSYEALVTGRSPLLVTLKLLTPVTAALALGATCGLVPAWRRRWWGLPTRLVLTLAAAAPAVAVLVISRYGTGPW